MMSNINVLFIIYLPIFKNIWCENQNIGSVAHKVLNINKSNNTNLHLLLYQKYIEKIVRNQFKIIRNSIQYLPTVLITREGSGLKFIMGIMRFCNF